jgi:LuxR family maltose regulon positive regulatory protein
VEHYRLIRTKLQPPVQATGGIPRERILRGLDREPPRKLTLVWAPAGFGKTTLLGQWFEVLKARGAQVCWLSLDFKDNDPARFLHYIVAALRETLPALGEDALGLTLSSAFPDISTAVDSLINDLAAVDADATLFIDDYHHTRSGEIDRFVELLLRLSPDNFRLVIASRINSLLAVSTLAMRDEVKIINVSDLRFDHREAADFVLRAKRVQLTEAQMAKLHERSDGWAAGLQLACLSLRKQAQPDEFIASFSGNMREIADYLAADVLERQPPATRDFLLRTSVLNRFNAEVCNHLTGHGDARIMLDSLEGESLFVTALDADRIWYRYHDLFHEFLVGQLRRHYPGEMVGLYRRAARWFAGAELLNEAVNYALLAGDLDEVAALVQTGALERLMMEGRMTDTLAWVRSLPESIKDRFPRLLIRECIALSHLSRPREAALVLDRIHAAVQPRETGAAPRSPKAEQPAMESEIAALPACIAAARDDVDAALTATAAALDTRDDLMLGILHNVRGYALIHTLDLAGARAHLSRGRHHHVKRGTHYGAVFSDCWLAMLDLLQYRLRTAAARLADTERLALAIEGGHVHAMAKVRVMQACLWLECGRADEAVPLLRAELPFIDEVGLVSIPLLGYLALARGHAAQGRYDAAEAALERCLAVTAHALPERVAVPITCLRIKIACTRAAPGAPGPLPESVGPMSSARKLHGDLIGFHCGLAAARLALALGDLDNASAALDGLVPAARSAHLVAFVIESLLLKAQVLGQLGDRSGVAGCIAQAMALTAPEEGMQLWQDEGVAFGTLLQGHAADAAALLDATGQHHLGRVIAALARSGRCDHRRGADPGAPPCAAEDLSARESEVLRLIAAGRANLEIAAALEISENTVKWHVKNIFGKLGVSNRTSAVVVAQQRSWLSQRTSR